MWAGSLLVGGITLPHLGDTITLLGLVVSPPLFVSLPLGVVGGFLSGWFVLIVAGLLFLSYFGISA